MVREDNSNEEGGSSALTWILVGLLVLVLAAGVGLTVWLVFFRKCKLTWDQVSKEANDAAEFPTGAPLSSIVNAIDSNCAELQAAYRDPCKINKVKEVAEKCPQGIDNVLVRVPIDAFEKMQTRPMSAEDREIMELILPMHYQHSTDPQFQAKPGVPVAMCITEQQKRDWPAKFAEYIKPKKPSATPDSIKTASDSIMAGFMTKMETCRGSI